MPAARIRKEMRVGAGLEIVETTLRHQDSFLM